VPLAAAADVVSMTTTSDSAWLRSGMIAAYAVLQERNLERQWQLISADALRLLDATTASVYDLDADGRLELRDDHALLLPADAERLERELVRRAHRQDRSLISTHPHLDHDLRPLAAACRAAGIVTHALLVRAHGRSHGALALHWLGRERPPYERRSGFYAYWDTIGLAVAAARERALIEVEVGHLRERAYTDRLTGLPNALALEEELRRHEETTPLSVLALDFDGMREANAAFASYEAGGDVLIRAVGRALPTLVGDAGLAARLHTAGDEFAVLLPGADDAEAERVAREVEGKLDALDVPETHRAVYHGASVGWATRTTDETPGQALGRAIAAMQARKSERRGG
jgi:diguanylate cyclase (GGDEF)-like protein